MVQKQSLGKVVIKKERTMSTSIIRIEDASKDELVLTKDFKYAHWPFDTFNQVQSAIFPHVSTDTNITIAAATSAGKTVMGEMYMADEIRRRKGKAVYVGPLKALAKEKQDDWSDLSHHFNDLKKSICTGDFRLTNARIKELDRSDVIVMTPEMLASRCRNQKSEKSNFLKEVGTIVFDESHLLTVPSRGDHIEVALMKMVNINPNLRIVLLSATMPNVDEISEWISSITGRDTVLIESDYRPCPLKIHHECYRDQGRYEEKERAKVSKAVGIVNHFNQDKCLVFVHTKNTGKLVVDSLAELGIQAEFHNADLSFDKRVKLEEKFKNDPNFRVVVATSTLAWGCNLPARRVVIVGVHRGVTPVENYDIRQMIGRSGRPKYDPRGDAHILIPDSHEHYWKARLEENTVIRSQLLEDISGHHKTLAFHVISEIHHKSIQTREGFYKWFSTSLAHFQDQRFDDEIIDQVIDLLEKMKCVTVEDGKYKTTPVGNIASMFYFSPFDVSDLKKNFHFLFKNKMENNEFATALALGNLDSHRFNIVNKAEKAEIENFRIKVESAHAGRKYTEGAIKAACTYYKMMTGQPLKALANAQSAIRMDLERTMEVVNAIDQMSAKWKKKNYFSDLKQRILYGVKPELLDLVGVPGLGKVRAERLHEAGISFEEIPNTDDAKLSEITKIKDLTKIQKIKKDAKLAALRKML